MFLGILIAFLGAVSAISIGTPTTPENATRASVGPRRNGFSDLPSSVSSYNTEQYWNAIPEYVMANDPATGNDAIIYTREEIFTAMQVGDVHNSNTMFLELIVFLNCYSKVTRFYNAPVIRLQDRS